MRDEAARTRTGLAGRPQTRDEHDARIRVTLRDLMAFERRATAVSFLPRQPARSALNGRHASRLRGRGLNFEELRGYLPGDDVRAIDWKVTARTGEPHVRVYSEERDRPALLVIDQRMSMFFGSRLNMKSVTAAEAAALVAYRVLDQGDRIGALVFGDETLVEIRPQRSRRTVNVILTAVAEANAKLHAEAATVEPLPLNRPLEAAAQIARRDHLIIVLSDFDGVDRHTEKLLGGLVRHNDVVLVLVTDPMAQEIPDHLRLIVSDGELQAEIDSASGRVRRALAELSSGRLAEILGWQQSLRLSVLPLSAGDETLPQIRRLMGRFGGAHGR